MARTGIASHSESHVTAGSPTDCYLEGVTGAVAGARTDIEQIIARKKSANDFDVLLVLHGQITYTVARPKWVRSKVHKIFRDRSYIGEVFHRGEWHPGRHAPLLDRTVWSRVQALMGECVYKAHD